MGNKELNMKLGQLQEKISKASLTVGADLSNDFKSIVLETSQWRLSPFIRLFWKEQQKYLQSSQNNATYHPVNPNTVIKSAQHCLYNSGKGRYTWCKWNNDMFIPWNHISVIFHEDREWCFTHLVTSFKVTYQVDPLLKDLRHRYSVL